MTLFSVVTDYMAAYFAAFFVFMFFVFVFVDSARNDLGLYARQIMIACTQFFNVITGGHPDQSFSGRSGINRQLEKPGWKTIAGFIDWVFLKGRGQENHCDISIERDRPALVPYKKGIRAWVYLVFSLIFIHVTAQLLLVFLFGADLPFH